ncbi:Helix-loop-helix DNA-binding domain protein [Dictyocaulus viviparus]|uniref:Helix-loop-helix DNA-binding domain protein n=1 Tax=Dictyocaulus viviparus TaxID=29172 RepID=A0A0D8XQH0_DICVI|nr:Helix-loop-helix DNA-binding domain protein [Dictyocaulus viviparus]
MKKPMMEKLRRKRINDSLLYLKEFLLNVSPQQSSKLEKADILEWTVRYLEEQRGNHSTATETAAVYQSGREEGFARGFAHASQTVFSYLQMTMPHDFNPQAQQFHLGLVHHLNAALPSRSGLPTLPPISEPSKWIPGTPPTSDTSSSESPEPTELHAKTKKSVKTTASELALVPTKKDHFRKPPLKKVWQPWQ